MVDPIISTPPTAYVKSLFGTGYAGLGEPVDPDARVSAIGDVEVAGAVPRDTDNSVERVERVVEGPDPHDLLGTPLGRRVLTS